MDIRALFKADDEQRVRLTDRREDLHVFNLLDSILPGTTDIVAAAEHDVIFLGVDVDQLSKAATEEQVRELMRCGVMFDTDVESLFMFS